MDLEAMKKRAQEQPNASDTLRLVAEVERLKAALEWIASEGGHQGHYARKALTGGRE